HPRSSAMRPERPLMLAFVVRRLIGAIAVLIAVSFIVFLIFIVVPGGDPATRIAGKNANDQLIANIKHSWGFDQPFYTQYAKMMEKAFTGKLVSYTNQTNVTTQIKEGLAATFSLSIGAAIIWMAFGILVGVISAVKAGRWSDRVITIVALIGISMPVFWLGILTRYFAAVLGGVAILTETVFDLHGVGQYAAQSIGAFDLPPIMGVTLFGAFFIVLFSAIVDFVYAFLDPRIRPS